MAINKSALSSRIIKVLAFTAVAIILLILPTACANFFSKKASSQVTTEGFDFSYSLDETVPGRGPKMGEKVDISALKTSAGIKFSSIANQQLIMLVTVDPNCGACQTAADEIRDVHRRIKEFGVPSYLVSFTSSNPPSEFFRYTNAFGVQTPAFLWDMTEKKPPELLYTMVLPSHLLVDSNGVVIRKWVGTDKQQLTRRKMANQIVADVSNELSHRTNNP